MGLLRYSIFLSEMTRANVISCKYSFHARLVGSGELVPRLVCDIKHNGQPALKETVQLYYIVAGIIPPAGYSCFYGKGP